MVSKCASCALAMPGKGDHAATVGDYELHFCSVGCKEGFSEDMGASVMALNVPAEAPVVVEQ